MSKDKEATEVLAEPMLVVPVLPLRDVVVYPHMVIPLFVGREKSIRALDTAMAGSKQILLVAQQSAELDDPTTGQIHRVGTLSTILQLLKLPDGTIKVLVEGAERARVVHYLDQEDYFTAQISLLKSVHQSDEREMEVLARSVMHLFDQYVKLNKKVPPEILTSLAGIDEPARLADTIAAHMSLKLDEQMKAIQKELGDMEDSPNEVEELARKIESAGMPKEAKEKATAELNKLRMMSPMSAEATVLRNYVDWLVNSPWKAKSRVRKDLAAAQKVLDEDHYGLEKVKERILEYLAVQHRVKQLKGPILCLVGPPGVGKTSLGRSIARATGRKFTRMSLGGVRDEAEIRGHRRTYIGSLPGKIIQNLAKVKVRNPLFLLDEVDKMAMDFRGDPASALLEVLDPEQNNTFSDHYLEVDFDLSDVMFVTTANSMAIPGPLLDRMEVIRLPGYTEDEKANIAERYLIPKQVRSNGLKKNELTISETAVRDLIRHYTREAGVRNLEREISKICRKVVKSLMLKPRDKSVVVTARNLDKYLGVRRFRYGIAEEKDQVGQATGLAWTEVGGELLTIETAVVPGKGKLTQTGQLGDVMQESVQAALTVVRSRAEMLGIAPDFYENRDIHVHVPEGATPKDGPSAGIGMTTALVSALTGIPVHANVAMTGEITLRGEVLPIGGLKEKLLAAHRGGISIVVIPSENEKDLVDIPKNIKQKLEIKPVRWIDEVLEIALHEMPEPRTVSGEKQVQAAARKKRDEEQKKGGRVRHH